MAGSSSQILVPFPKPHIVRLLKYVFSCLLLIILLLLSGCSTPGKAPVSTRGKVVKSQLLQRPKHYRVAKGDTLYSISWRFSIGYHTLARWNGLRSPYTIYPGQRIRLYALSSNKRSSSASKKITGKVKVVAGNTQKHQATKKQSRSTSLASKGNKSTKKSSNTVLKLHWNWPTKGIVVQRFIKGDPQRKGVTIGGRSGASIRAAEAGKVVYAGSGLIGYGKLIIIKHNKNYLSAYGHNRKILVKEGVQVKKGARIAEMGTGSTGRPLLHFEIRRNGAPTDPIKLLPRRR